MLRSHPESAVLSKVFNRKVIDYVEPKFYFKLDPKTETESFCTFTPPIRYSRWPCIETVHLYISADTGCINITPFEVGGTSSQTEHSILGGVVVGLGGEEKIILVASERSSSNQPPIHSLNLLKVHENDKSIFVRPALKKDGVTPLSVYQLENLSQVFGIKRIGLGIFTNGIRIIHKNNSTLIETRMIKQ